MFQIKTSAVTFIALVGFVLADDATYPHPPKWTPTPTGDFAHTPEPTSVVYFVTHAANTYPTGTSTKEIKTYHTRTHKTRSHKKHTSTGTSETIYPVTTAGYPTISLSPVANTYPTGASTKQTKTHHTRTRKTRSHKTWTLKKHTSTSTSKSSRAHVTAVYPIASTSHSFTTKPGPTQLNPEWPLCLRGGDCTSNAVPTAVYPTTSQTSYDYPLPGPVCRDCDALKARAEPIAVATSHSYTVRLGPVPTPGMHFTTSTTATSDSNKKIKTTDPRHIPSLWGKPTSAHYHNASLHTTISYHPIRTTIPPYQATSIAAPKSSCTASFLRQLDCCEDFGDATATITKTMPCGSCATATVIGIDRPECDTMRCIAGPHRATEYVCADNKPSRATCLDDVKEKGICHKVAFLYSDKMLCRMGGGPKHCRYYNPDYYNLDHQVQE